MKVQTFLIGTIVGVVLMAGASALVDASSPKYKMCVAGAAIAITELDKFGMIEPSEVNVVRAADNIAESCKAAAE